MSRIQGDGFTVEADDNAAREWEAEFERQTGKRIIDGRVELPNPQLYCHRIIMEFRRVHLRDPRKLRLSPDMPYQLLRESLGERRWSGQDMEDVLSGRAGTFIMGIPATIDAMLEENTVVAE